MISSPAENRDQVCNQAAFTLQNHVSTTPVGLPAIRPTISLCWWCDVSPAPVRPTNAPGTSITGGRGIFVRL
jgi:hypothetical protein